MFGTTNCKNCGEFFKEDKIRNSLLSNYKPIECDNCGTTHYVSKLSRGVYALSVAIPIVLTGIFDFVGLVLGVSILILLYILSPYLMWFK
ncbi:TIGR04104 family putative zinc finger protein [Natranaerobius thermophilus]|uniref:TIGR04104 family putative zinc finger protein n=1 Tax=Natranaerobius thermophilus TaxID=375929 RepID=UPI000A03F421